MAECNWQMEADEVLLLLLSFQDDARMAANRVIATESRELGSCSLGYATQFETTD